MDRRQPDVIVLGAGVIGLTTGVCLAERGLRVQVFTRVVPASTTSAVASAMIGPSFASADDPVAARERVGIEEFTRLAAVPGTGVAFRRGRLVSREAGSLPPGVELCTADELPVGFAAGFWTSLPLVDMPVYLDYLVRRLTAAGGQIDLEEVGSLAELAERSPLLANCAGLGARELVPDPSVRPIRGQQVVVDNPGLEEFFIEAPVGAAWTAYWPHSGHVVLGSTVTVDDEDSDPSPATAEEILRRCVEVEPRLRHAQVRGHQVGLRPGRPSVRLEVEQIGASRCAHNYGHGGSGVTLSWGCAHEAAALLTDGGSR